MAHAAIAHRDTKVRTGALAVLGALYSQLGPALKTQALPESLAPAAAKQIGEALDKIQFDPAVAAQAAPKVGYWTRSGSGSGWPPLPTAAQNPLAAVQ